MTNTTQKKMESPSHSAATTSVAAVAVAAATLAVTTDRNLPRWKTVWNPIFSMSSSSIIRRTQCSPNTESKGIKTFTLTQQQQQQQKEEEEEGDEKIINRMKYQPQQNEASCSACLYTGVGTCFGLTAYFLKLALDVNISSSATAKDSNKKLEMMKKGQSDRRFLLGCATITTVAGIYRWYLG